MAVTEIRPYFAVRDASDALLEYLQGLNATDPVWRNWTVQEGYPDDDTGGGERRLLICLEYERIVERIAVQGGHVAVAGDGGIIKGFMPRLEFSITVRASEAAGWDPEILVAISALVYYFTSPFANPASLRAMGFCDFEIDSVDRDEPTRDRPHVQRTLLLRVTVPTVARA